MTITDDDWQRMKPDIEHFYVHQRHSLQETRANVGEKHELWPSLKQLRTRVTTWGFHTYAKRSTSKDGGVSRTASESTRKRKRTIQHVASAKRPYREIIPSPYTNRLLRPNNFRPEELMQYSIDQLVAAVFGDRVKTFTFKDLLSPNLDHRLAWEEIGCIYWHAEHDFRTGFPDLFVESLSQVHDKLRLLVLLGGETRVGFPRNIRTGIGRVSPAMLQRLQEKALPPSPDVLRLHHQAFLYRFWSLCLRLLKYDSRSGYQFSFAIHFLLELEDVFGHNYGKSHPLRSIVYALCQKSKEDLRNALELGAARTIEVMVPRLKPPMTRAKMLRMMVYYRGLA